MRKYYCLSCHRRTWQTFRTVSGWKKKKAKKLGWKQKFQNSQGQVYWNVHYQMRIQINKKGHWAWNRTSQNSLRSCTFQKHKKNGIVSECAVRSPNLPLNQTCDLLMENSSAVYTQLTNKTKPLCFHQCKLLEHEYLLKVEIMTLHDNKMHKCHIAIKIRCKSVPATTLPKASKSRKTYGAVINPVEIQKARQSATYSQSVRTLPSAPSAGFQWIAGYTEIKAQ